MDEVKDMIIILDKGIKQSLKDDYGIKISAIDDDLFKELGKFNHKYNSDESKSIQKILQTFYDAVDARHDLTTGILHNLSESIDNIQRFLVNINDIEFHGRKNYE